MALLALERVSKRFGRGSGERIALHDVSLELEEGELVGVWGRRRSGRSTLLRVAAGIERPDEGIVRMQGRSLNGSRAEELRAQAGFCRRAFRAAEGNTVLEQLITGQLTRGVSLDQARTRARRALNRLGAQHSASMRPGEMDGAEATRVAIARVIVREPKLLLIDEPTLGVDLPVRDEILALLRALADEGIAVLYSATDTSVLTGADRALSLAKGSLNGEPSTPELAPVVPLHLAAAGSAGA
jgi:ABC-type multidrug transport system ATPase subunit